MKKLVFAASVFLTGLFYGFTQTQNSENDPSWRVLEQAEVQFDYGNYGEALRLANRALDLRKDEGNYEYTTIDVAISPAQVKRAGSEFDKVIPVLEERGQKEALKIISKYLNLYGKNFFEDDVRQLANWLKERTVYPEADFLIGKIYRTEGEYKTAYSFYNKALEEKEYLDIADVEYNILYAMAELAKQKDDTESYEKTLLLILDSDDFFKNKTLHESILRTINTDKQKNVDRLFLLYRADSKYSIKALYELSKLYQKKGLKTESLKYLALGTIEAFTHLEEVLEERNSRFKYTTYENFLKECGKYSEILSWAQKNQIWTMMVDFADAVAGSGKLVFAQTLYVSMANGMPDAYYKKLAESRINVN